jgi:uncharacterized protein YjiS (DUF1127 family)
MKQTAVHNQSFFVTVTEWFFHAARNVWREYRMRQATRVLGGLEDRELNDMGIPRGGIEDAVRFGRSGTRTIRP